MANTDATTPTTSPPAQPSTPDTGEQQGAGEATGTTAVVAYRNVRTKQVIGLTEVDPRFEAQNEWERCDPGEVKYAVADAYDRALAERRSIEAAAAIRLDSAAGSAIRGVAAAAAYNTGNAAGEGHQPEPLPTLSTGDAGEKQQLVPLLDKTDPLRRTTTTSAEDHERAAEYEIANPPRSGVLARAKADHKSGATQISEPLRPSPQEAIAAQEKSTGKPSGPPATEAEGKTPPADDAGRAAGRKPA